MEWPHPVETRKFAIDIIIEKERTIEFLKGDSNGLFLTPICCAWTCAINVLGVQKLKCG